MELFLKRLAVFGCLRIGLSNDPQHPNRPHPAGLLLRNKRPRYRRCDRRRPTAKQRDELSPRHSITSSARASKIGETSKPKALAVLRLTTNSNLVPCSTGKSAGFAPLRILSTKVAERYQVYLRLTE